MVRITWTVSLAWVAFVAAACGGAASSESTPAFDVTDAAPADGGAEGSAESAADALPDANADCELPQWAVDFYTRYARAACDGFAGCCSSAGMSFPADDCADSWVSTVRSMIAPSFCHEVNCDPAAADECIAAVTAYAQACDDDSRLYDAVASACGHAVYGPTPVGEPCDNHLDCAQPPGGYTVCLGWSSSSGESGSLCQQIVVHGEGEPCSDEFSHEPILPFCDTSKGLWCDTLNTGTCLPRLQIGDSCPWNNGDEACPDDAYCDGTCKERAPVGTACDGGLCVKGARCAETGVCVITGAIGAACSDAPDCANYRCEHDKCVPTSVLVGMGHVSQCQP